MPTIQLPNNWEPRYYQRNLWEYFEKGGKRGIAVWHRRAGKDDVCLHRAAVGAFERVGNYWHMLPEYSQARKAIWEAVNPHTGERRINEAFPKELRRRTNNQEMFIEFKNGSTWQVVGSDNYDSLVGSAPVGIVFSEWALADPDAWAYLGPILEENGGWAMFITTSRGDNHAKKLFNIAEREDDWFCETLTPEETGIFSQQQLDKILREYVELYGLAEGTVKFQQEYLCMWVNSYNGKVVYPDFRRKMHVSKQDLLPFIREAIKVGRPIVRGWDHSGLHPACVLTYLNTIGQWFLFREFWEDNVDIVDFGESVLTWCNMELPGAKFRDIGDPAGNIRDSRKKSANHHLQNEIGLVIEDGVQTFKVRKSCVAGRLSKLVQGEPAMVIDPSCVMTIDGFEGAYCYPEVGKNTGVYRTEPLKDKYADVHDAIQYPATLLFGAPKYNEDHEEEDRYVTGRNRTTGY